MSEPFIGEIRSFGFNFAPIGWAQCNGQLLPIAQNTALFSILGTYYGGDGKSTFGLPNLMGRLPMGASRGSNLSQRQLGESGGVESVSLTAPSLSSSVIRISARETIDLRLLSASIVSGGASTPFHNMPST